MVWLSRQSGKSTFLATIAILTLLTTPGSYVVFIAASEPQAQSIFHRKIRRVLGRLLRALGADRRSLLITKRSIEFLEIGSKLRRMMATRRRPDRPEARPKLLLWLNTAVKLRARMLAWSAGWVRWPAVKR